MNRSCDALFKLACNNIGEDLKLAMRMCAEPGARLDSVFIDHAQCTKSFMAGALIPIEQSVKAQSRGDNHAYMAKSNVWKLFNQPWSAFPRSWLGRVMILRAECDMV